MVCVLIVSICCWLWEEQITNWSGRDSFEILLKVAVDSTPVSVSLSNVKTFVDMQCHGQNRHIVVIIKIILFSLLILEWFHTCTMHMHSFSPCGTIPPVIKQNFHHYVDTKKLTMLLTCLLNNNKCKLHIDISEYVLFTCKVWIPIFLNVSIQ